MSKHAELIERLYEESQDNTDDDRWQAADALEAQAREIEGLRKDAERYRLLRACGVDSYEACGSGEKLDAECDAAIAAKGAPHG